MGTMLFSHPSGIRVDRVTASPGPGEVTVHLYRVAVTDLRGRRHDIELDPAQWNALVDAIIVRHAT